MSNLFLTFYGDDFTGATDALEQLALAGIRAALFIEPPSPARLKHFSGLQAVGVAGLTRSMTPAAMAKALRPALKKLKVLGAPHVHYKVCSTFDSSPKIGSIGRVIDVAVGIFRAPFVPVLVAAPLLGRYCLFGNLFARFGIGSNGEIYRLDRHPSMSRHPITPMTESDLRLHLAKQTKKRIALFDILKVALPESNARAALNTVLADKPDVVLFDALFPKHLECIGGLIDAYASAKRPLFSVGSSGIEMALCAHWKRRTGVTPVCISIQRSQRQARRLSCSQILVGSGSCSPVTKNQIAWALRHGFAEVPLSAAALASDSISEKEIQRGIELTVKHLRSHRSVIIHTGGHRSSQHTAKQLKIRIASVLGTALGKILRGVQAQNPVRRLCIAGGDTSSYAARALGVEAVEMIAPLTPGAPVCRAFAPNSPVDGCEIVFKGGQVGAEKYFEIVKRGKL